MGSRVAQKGDRMSTLRATAIMKTDISGSTVRFRSLAEADLNTQLAEHRQLVSRIAAKHEGHVVKPEGDGFWLVFPSVTAAALAAMTMQEELRFAQANKTDDRIVMRIVIALGDVSHQDGALIGDTVVLTARIEAITPPDEIYLSHAAWLAVSQAEVRTAFVDSVNLRGFSEPALVYRIEQRHRTRVLTDQYIVISDLRGFTTMVRTSPIAVVESVLDRLLEIVVRACREFQGANRFSAGDMYCLTFTEARLAMSAVDLLWEEWGKHDESRRCELGVAVHKGTTYAFRSYLYGTDIDITTAVERLVRYVPRGEPTILVTGNVRRDLAGTLWEGRLEPLDAGSHLPEFAKVEVFRVRSA